MVVNSIETSFPTVVEAFFAFHFLYFDLHVLFVTKDT